jgi:hypothetical protein
MNGATQFLTSTADNRVVTGMKIYVDHIGVFATTDNRITKTTPLTPGTHWITVKGWDALGSFSKSFSYTTQSCTPSALDRNVRLCSPTGGSISSSPVHILAAITDSRTVNAVKVYIDGVSQFTTTSKKVDFNWPLPPGQHRVTVKAWDSLGSFSTTSNFTVQ